MQPKTTSPGRYYRCGSLWRPTYVSNADWIIRCCACNQPTDRCTCPDGQRITEAFNPKTEVGQMSKGPR